jgi:hypothetical protein
MASFMIFAAAFVSPGNACEWIDKAMFWSACPRVFGDDGDRHAVT